MDAKTPPDATNPDAYGTLIEPTTLKIQRLLPGPIERIWAYLTDSELRRKWLAAGAMEMKVGSPFELTWRNDELSDGPNTRPEGFPEQHSMQSRARADARQGEGIDPGARRARRRPPADAVDGRGEVVFVRRAQRQSEPARPVRRPPPADRLPRVLRARRVWLARPCLPRLLD